MVELCGRDSATAASSLYRVALWATVSMARPGHSLVLNKHLCSDQVDMYEGQGKEQRARDLVHPSPGPLPMTQRF